MRAMEQLRRDNAVLWATLASLQRAVLYPGPEGPLRMRNVLRYLKTEVLGDPGQDESLFLDRLGNHPRLGELAQLLAKERDTLRAQLDEVREAVDTLHELGGLDSWAISVRARCDTFIRDFLHHLFIEERVFFPEVETWVEAERLEEIGAVMAALRAHARGIEEVPALD